MLSWERLSPRASFRCLAKWRLAKLAWEILGEPGSAWAEIFRSWQRLWFHVWRPRTVARRGNRTVHIASHCKLRRDSFSLIHHIKHNYMHGKAAHMNLRMNLSKSEAVGPSEVLFFWGSDAKLLRFAGKGKWNTMEHVYRQKICSGPFHSIPLRVTEKSSAACTSIMYIYAG